MHEQRLLNVVRALRESPAPESFDMAFYAHECGTPACALGHYAARPDLQGDFGIDEWGNLNYGGEEVLGGWGREAHHFGITEHESEELFDEDGCGGVITPNQAADYIMAFIEIRRSAAAPSAELAVVASRK